MIHFDAKNHKSEAQTKVKQAKIKRKNWSETKIKRKNWQKCFFHPKRNWEAKQCEKKWIFLLLKRKSFPPRFASKQKLLNRIKAKNLKRKKAKKEMLKFYSEIGKRIQFRFISLISENFFLLKRAHPSCNRICYKTNMLHQVRSQQRSSFAGLFLSIRDGELYHQPQPLFQHLRGQRKLNLPLQQWALFHHIFCWRRLTNDHMTSPMETLLSAPLEEATASFLYSHVLRVHHACCKM